MRKFKLLTLLLISLLLSSCFPYIIKQESNKTTQEQQQEVKIQVMQLLQDEYKQPFKLESFEYKYETHWEHIDCQIAGYCPKVQYGTYYFKIQAVDNPIIEMDFRIDDYNPYEVPARKESIKNFIL